MPLKSQFLGNSKCSRCGGGDPNCMVCNSPSDLDIDLEDSDEDVEILDESHDVDTEEFLRACKRADSEQ